MKWMLNAEGHKTRVTLSLLAAVIVAAPAWAKPSTIKSGLGLSLSSKMNRLNYPALPPEVVSKNSKGKEVTVKAKPDSSLGQEWGLVNIGFFEVFNPLIQPIRPQQVQRCSPEIVVAVVDTGVDYTHPELRDHLWVNRGEVGAWSSESNPFCFDKSCNGLDDDGDGLIDDVVGWDFVNNVPLPFDTHGHGTHISGIISSTAANGLGASGVCPGVTIMPLKYYDSSGMGYNNLQNTVKSIEFAVKHGAHIINYSGGGSEAAPAEKAAIEFAQSKGILFVAAAGNDGHDNERNPYYPASYGLDNIISVASVNPDNRLLPSSNFGKTVHVAAPGLSIFSTLNGGRYGTMSGTSQATAFVSGAAALLASQVSSKAFEFRQLKRWILNGTKPLPRVEKGPMFVSNGLLSIPNALNAQKIETKTLPITPEVAARAERNGITIR